MTSGVSHKMIWQSDEETLLWPENRTQVTNTDRMHILFVDDTFETRDLFRFFFTLQGHSTETAHNGLEALRIIQQSPSRFDVIILDYHMPQMNGLEVVQELRQKEDAEPVPIILFTGDAKDQVVTEAHELGVARVVHKPFLPSDLLAVAVEVVSRV